SEQFAASANRVNQQTRVTTSTLRSMGREIEKLTQQESTLQQIQRQNRQLSQQQAAALHTVQGRLRELNTQYSRLSNGRRLVVGPTRALVQPPDVLARVLRSMQRFAGEVAAAERETAREAPHAPRADEQPAKSSNNTAINLHN